MWIKASSDLAPSWDKEKQKTVEGCITEKKEHVGQYDSTVVTVEQKGGEKVAVWAKGVLEGQLKPLPVGSIIRVTYTGKVKTKNGRMANAFDLEYDQESVDSASIFNK